MFQPVDNKKSLPELERELVKYWQDNQIFQKSVEKNKDNPKFTFFDGPPFANGLPHYGHILAMSLKDAVTRYQTMQGKYVPRTNGWDCHGLPVEYEIEKETGITGQKAIKEHGIDKFNQLCRESVFKYTGQWQEMFGRIARWADESKTYATLDNNYMESIWWVFKQIWDKGLVYEGYRPMHISPLLETPLSNFEVSLAYKDVTDLSATAKFKLNADALEKINQEGKDIYILAWTTTPWTLPGNVALALGEDIKYVLVKHEENLYILAEDLIKANFNDDFENIEIIQEINPKDLENTTYQPLFDYYSNDDLEGKYCTIQIADFVTTESGTGIVHIATMFGEDDFYLGEEKGLAKILHVGMDGKFIDKIKGYEGKFVKGQDLNIAHELEEKGLLFKKENYRHSYPHCWRTDGPLLNYTTKSLFIKVTDVKDQLIENNKQISWQPDHIQQGRFGKWLEGARDWSISRNRFWGCPIPVWESVKTGEKICIGSIEELEKLSKGKLPLDAEGNLDLHKPYIDDIILYSPTDGSEMRRIPDVFDCWFESGSMPYAQLHYPFENKELFENNFPADFIAEGQDQTRGWFYTLHVISTLLFNKPAFKNVICTGMLLAKDGQKLSKSKRNYPEPSELFEEKGVDALRLFLYQSNVPLAESTRFSDDHVDEVMKKFSLTLWNTYSFFITYANIDKFTKNDVDIENFKQFHELDQFIISKLHQLIKEVTSNMEEYNLPKATRPIIEFVDTLSNWYIRRSRRRFWKTENDQDKFQAFSTLYYVLENLSRLCAPFTPFISDSIYKNLTGEESVHLANYPKFEKQYVNQELSQKMDLARQVINSGHSLRSQANIKVRQPLSKVQIAVPQKEKQQILNQLKEVIKDELNVKTVEILDSADGFVKKTVKPNAKVLGPQYGHKMKEIINAARQEKFQLNEDTNTIAIAGETISLEGNFEIQYLAKEGTLAESTNGIATILETELSQELIQEGTARDTIRQIQEFRKDMDLAVDQRITVYIESKDKDFNQSITNFADIIREETLADELQQSGNFEWDDHKISDINNIQVTIGIKKC